jgi:tape measure domain-containing protein
MVIEFDASQVKEGSKVVIEALKQAGVSFEQLSMKGKKTRDEHERIERQFRKVTAELDPLIRAQQKYARQINIINADIQRLGKATEAHNRAIRQAGERYWRTAGSSKGFINSLFTMRNALLGLGVGAAIGQIKMFVKSLMDAELKMQAVERRFRVAFNGDNARAAGGVEYARDVAGSFGLDFGLVADGLSRLTVAARGTALEGEQVKKVFLGVAQASAAMSLSADDTAGALRAVEQMISKGKVTAEELRGQLGERLPGAFQLMAKAAGVSTARLDEMLKQGDVGIDILDRFADELMRAFGPEARANADSLQGSINGLSTAWFDLKRNIVEAGLGDAISASFSDAKKGLEGFTSVIRDSDAVAKSVGFSSLFDFLSFIINPKNAADKIVKPVSDAIDFFRGGGAAGTSSAATSSASPKSIVPPVTEAQVKSFKDALKHLTDGYVELQEAEKKATAEQESFNKSLEGALKGLDPVMAASRNYSETATLLARGLEEGRIGADEYAAAMRRLLNDLNAVRDATKKLALLKVEMWSQPVDLDQVKLPGVDRVQFTQEADQYAKDLEDIARNFYEGLQTAVADSIYEFVKTGEISFDSLWDTFVDLAYKAIAQVVAKWAAQKFAMSVSGGGGEGGAGAAGYLKYLNNPYAWAAAAAIAVLAISNNHRKQQEAKQYNSQAQFSGQGGVFNSGISGNDRGITQEILASLRAFWDSIKAVPGMILGDIASMQIAVRRDGKKFKVSFYDEIIGIFNSADEALVAGIKEQFKRSQVSGGPFAEVIKDYVSNFNGTEAKKLMEGVDYLSQILRESSDMSDAAYSVQTIIANVKGVQDKLVDLGMELGKAAAISYQWGAQQFANARRSITGEQESQKEELARRKTEAALYNAQLALYRAELTARKAYLEGQLQGQKIQGKLFQGEIEAWRGYLGGRQQAAEANVAIMNAELAAIDAALSALKGLDIDLGKIKLSGGGKGFGSHVGKFGGLVETFKRAVDAFRDTIMAARLGEGTSPLTERERVAEAYKQFQTLLTAAKGGNVTAAGELGGAYTQLLELAKSYSGGGSGLDFLGLGGGSFKEFFDALEALSLGFVNGPRPKKLHEGNVWTDARIVDAQNRTSKEVAAHREKSANQLRVMIASQEATNKLLEQQLAELKKASGTARVRAA